MTILRMDMLYNPNYGENTSYTVQSRKIVAAADNYCAWKGMILEPQNLAGAEILIFSDAYRPGILTLGGALYPPVQYRNPGQGWHYKRKIYSGEIGVLNHPDVLYYQASSPSFLERMRSLYRTNLVRNLGGDSASLALALTTGDRSLLSGDLKSAIYLTGVGHIIALSGLHISILAGLITAVLAKSGLPRWTAAIISLGFIIAYVVFVGPSPSLVRAVLMSIYGIAALLAGREKLGLSALLWSGAGMLLFNPLWLFDYAFVFSFLATYICLVAGRRLEKYLTFLPEPVKRAASLSLIIQFTALPLNLYLFGSFSLWAPLANIVIVPLMPLLAGASFLAAFSGPFGSLVAVPVSLLLYGVADFLSLLSQLPLSLEMGGVKLAAAAATSCLFILCLSGLKKKYLVCLLIICLGAFPLYTVWQRQTCSVWFLDVGQGDAILIRNRGRWILVDCGDSFAGERAVVPALKFLGVERLAALIITHPHADHSGGLEAVLSSFPAEKIYVNNSFLLTHQDHLSKYQVVRSKVEIVKGVNLYSHNIDLHNLNDSSLLTSLEFKGIRLLLTGDIEAEGEKLYSGRLVRHQVVKAAHHGSSTSTSETFLYKVHPQSAIISCGLGNSYGFPDQATLSRLARAGTDVYRTDTSGCIYLWIWPWQAYTIFSFTRR